MLASVLITRSGVLFISRASWMGPIAWAARSSARPSQNCAMLKTALRTVGEFRPPRCQACPMERGWRSTPAVPTLWQLLQLMNQLLDRRGSKKRLRPSSSLASEYSLPARSGASWGIGSNSDRAVTSRLSLLSLASPSWAVAVAVSRTTAAQTSIAIVLFTSPPQYPYGQAPIAPASCLRVCRNRRAAPGLIGPVTQIVSRNVAYVCVMCDYTVTDWWKP